MSMYPGHRSIAGPPPANGGNRLNELLDQIRLEFETQVRQYEQYEHQRKTSDIFMIQLLFNRGGPGLGLVLDSKHLPTPAVSFMNTMLMIALYYHSPIAHARDAAHTGASV